MLYEVITRIDSRTVGNTDCKTEISNLTFFRREMPMPPTICLVEPSIILVAQGEKQMLVGGKSFPYNINRFLITSLDLPANSQVIVASANKPCLGLALKLDLRIMAELIAQGGLSLPMERSSDQGVSIGLGTVTPVLLDAFVITSYSIHYTKLYDASVLDKADEIVGAETEQAGELRKPLFEVSCSSARQAEA